MSFDEHNACGLHRGRVMNTEEWKAKHSLHNDSGPLFETEPFMQPHADWQYLVCSCGAKHLTTGES